MPAAVQHYLFTLNTNGTITITGYTGPGGDVTIPDTIAGLPVTSAANLAFYSCTNLTRVTIGNRVTNIGVAAFSACTRLISVTIGNSVATIGEAAFINCSDLTGVYFQGNVPSVGMNAFLYANQATVYYLPGTTGWGATFAGRPTAPWVLPKPVMLDFGPSFGLQTNRFGFIISWATNTSVVVEACTSLANPAWCLLQTNALTDGSSYFSDPGWTNYPGRFYRVRSP